MRMLFNRVLVLPDEAPDVVHGIVHVNAVPKTRGTVLAAGPAVRELKPGDRVIYPLYQGHELKIGDATVRLMDDLEVWSALDEEAEDEEEDVENIRPLGEFIYVERDATEELYGGVIIIPETGRKVKAPRATILKIGPYAGAPFEVGERVLLTVGVSSPILFGDAPGRTIYRCRPRQILMGMESDEEFDRTRTDMWRPVLSEADQAAMEGLAEEGVARRAEQ
jgi:co-chaperonin GroES (HSP10)